MSRQKQERMQELVTLLNRAAKAYYQDAQEIMSNLEYDRLYDELDGSWRTEIGDYRVRQVHRP